MKSENASIQWKSIIVLSPLRMKNTVIYFSYIFQDTTFLDYIRGGLKLHFVVAIDFTTSNGLPNDPNSLHYWDRQRAENPYTVAIRSVGEIFQDYDVGKQNFLLFIKHFFEENAGIYSIRNLLKFFDQ